MNKSSVINLTLRRFTVTLNDNMDSVLKISGVSGGKGYAGFLIEKDKLSEEPELRTKVMEIFSLCGISIVNMVSGIDSLDVFVSEKDVRGKIRELTARIKMMLFTKIVLLTVNNLHRKNV